jgi:hypothetical protein
MGDHRQVAQNGSPTLTAIVPASDAPATLGRCVAAIRDAADPPEEVIAVTEPAGIGPAAARNAGAATSNGQILVFVDADVIVHEDAFTRLRQAFASDPGLTAVFGSYDADPEAGDTVSTFRNLLHHHVHQAGAGPAATFWTGLGAVRREAFEEVGGFDEELFSEPRASVEDIDLGLRLVARGARAELDPRVQGTHLKQWTLSEMVKVDFARRGMPWVALLLRNRNGGRTVQAEGGMPQPGSVLNLGWSHRLSALACLVGAMAVLMRRPWVAVLSAVALLGLNRPFYALLGRRLGMRGMVAGVGLHAVHHLTAVSSAPAGAVLYLQWRQRVPTPTQAAPLP